MKGVTVNQLRTAALAILDKVDTLLKTEPARLIGYGAAVVVVLAAQVIGHFKPGVLPNIGFDEALGLTAAAITFMVVVVEAIRRAVYSPQTFIEELSDEWKSGHESAHAEEDAQRLLDEFMARRQAAAEAAVQPKTQTVAVGSTKAKGSGDKSN